MRAQAGVALRRSAGVVLAGDVALLPDGLPPAVLDAGLLSAWRFRIVVDLMHGDTVCVSFDDRVSEEWARWCWRGLVRALEAHRVVEVFGRGDVYGVAVGARLERHPWT